MDKDTETNEKQLFAPILGREANITLSELQHRVATRPAPTVSGVRYIAIAVVLLAIGSGVFFFFGNTQSEKNFTASKEAPHQEAVQPSSMPVKPEIAVASTSKHTTLHRISHTRSNIAQRTDIPMPPPSYDALEPLGSTVSAPSMLAASSKIDPPGLNEQIEDFFSQTIYTN